MNAKLGIALPSAREGNTYPCGTVEPSDFVGWCRDAEAAGFSSVWLNERIVAVPTLVREAGGIPDSYDPHVVAAFCAAATDSLEFVLSTVVAPVRNPVVYAKAVSSLAHLAPHRLHIALGLGSYAEEFRYVTAPDGMGTPRGLLLDRVLDRLRPASMSTMLESRRFRVSPPPESSPMRVLVTGSTPAGIARAAARADGVVVAGQSVESLVRLRKAMAERADESGRDPCDLSLYSQHWVAVGESEEEAGRVLLSSQYAAARRRSTGLAGSELIASFRRGNFLGTAQQVVDQIGMYECTEVDHMGLVFLGSDVATALRRGVEVAALARS